MIPVGFYSKCIFLLVLTLFLEVEWWNNASFGVQIIKRTEDALQSQATALSTKSLLDFLCLEPYRIMLPPTACFERSWIQESILFLGRCPHVAKTPGTIVNSLLAQPSTEISPEAHHLHWVAFPPKLNELNCVQEGCWLLKTVPTKLLRLSKK